MRLRNPDIHNICIAPAQGWHAESWSDPTFLDTFDLFNIGYNILFLQN